jgi:hypothetical protein
MTINININHDGTVLFLAWTSIAITRRPHVMPYSQSIAMLFPRLSMDCSSPCKGISCRFLTPALFLNDINNLGYTILRGIKGCLYKLYRIEGCKQLWRLMLRYSRAGTWLPALILMVKVTPQKWGQYMHPKSWDPNTRLRDSLI